MLQRDIYQKLIKWKHDKHKKPLLLQGARQVGKTFILKKFGKETYRHIFYVNFEKDPETKKFFEGTLNPKEIISKLSIYFDHVFDPQNTLIFFDEIQDCPAAITSLKYFCEETPQYDVVGAGSLLGVKLSKAQSFPVGKVNFLNMQPLTFFEFLEALDKKSLRQYCESIDFEKKNIKVDDPFHQQLMALLGIYLYVGGMPEAVIHYKKEKDLEVVRTIQENILNAYLLDFAKHAPHMQVNKITTIWQSIPIHLAKENRKFVFSAVAKSARAREYETAIQWLKDAGLIYQSYNVNKPQLPLEHYANKDCFKMFLFDVGLLSAMCQLSPQAVLSSENILTEFKGALTENFVAQEFAYYFNQSLYYWSNEGTGQAEVDFLISMKDKVFPVEVKANISRKKKSLGVYQQKYHPPFLIRISAMNAEKNGAIVNYPLYLAGLLSK